MHQLFTKKNIPRGVLPTGNQLPEPTVAHCILLVLITSMFLFLTLFNKRLGLDSYAVQTTKEACCHKTALPTKNLIQK